jgi:hypothetical protein
MNYLETNDDYRFDVDFNQLNVQIKPSPPNPKFPDFAREQPSIDLLNQILKSKIEMKSHMQTLKTGNLFIEYQIDNRGDGVLVPSGLSKSEAGMWFLNIGDMGLFLTDEFLKWIFNNKERLEIETKTNEKTADDHIGHGIIIPFWRILELQIEYNQIKETAATQKRIRELMFSKTLDKLI